MGTIVDHINSRLQGYREKRDHLLIGVMSGTSLDGADAVLTKIETGSDGSIKTVALVGQASIPYTGELKSILLALCSPETARVDDIVFAHFGLSEWYAAVVGELLAIARLDADKVDAICLHGQTIWHAPVPKLFPAPGGGTIPVKGTLQIGSGAVLRERTGIPVIFDFRSRDMAAGGEGAPLAPYVDALLFGSPSRGRIVQNIGGIGNATVIPAGSTREGIFAFDTGPGNMIIDELVRRKTKGAEHYDEGGRRARSGAADEDLVAELMADAYYAKQPPKSTGRELYNAAFVSGFIRAAGKRCLSFEDTVATATAFTAESIARSYRDFIYPITKIDDIVVGGGGALNGCLMDMIRERLPAGLTLMTTADLGIPELAREAMAFAVLGHEALMGQPGNLPAVTGAARDVILGNITL
ncbi:MAG: anhydro-N-acetylmuramic acid kinase [Spirochaetales bacterium]